MKTNTLPPSYVVVTHHYTEQDGETRTFTGPFPSEAEAVEWMDAQPDDEDVTEMYALPMMNAPTWTDARNLDTLRRVHAHAAATGPGVTVDADLVSEAGMDGNYRSLLQAARNLDASE